MKPVHAALSLSVVLAFGQQPRFEVASVKPSRSEVGKDANNRMSLGPAGLSGRNVTLKYLIAEAYHLQADQVAGPKWLEVTEYEIEARSDGPAGKEQLMLMLQAMLADRFGLTHHRETRQVRVYELVVDKTGPKIRPAKDAATLQPFNGDLQRFVDMIAVQLTIPISDNPGSPSRAGGTRIPVLNKTGLDGTYDLAIDIKPEPGVDMFTHWQRVLHDQLGLKLESQKTDVEVLVVDHADKLPASN
jgi:uncharacterized protein (TIGR03435 family)